MKKIIKFAALILAIMVLGSCEDYLDVNTDPNNPTEVTPDLILPVAQVYTANVLYGNTTRRLNDLANIMMYNWSETDGFSWYSDEFKYNVTTSFYDGVFEETYSNALKQYQILSELEDEYAYYKAISMIMKSYHFQILVDLYGDIPYTEALQRGANPTPAYDDAQTVYEDLIVVINEAIDLINNSPDAIEVGEDDVLFQGDMLMWKQFANSLKLRILVRQMNMSGRDTYIQNQINDIVAEGSGFITEDAGINPGYLKEEGKQNPMWNYLGWDASDVVTMNNNATCATDYIIEYLQNTNDGRLNRMYEQPETGHLGVPQGLLGTYPGVDDYTQEYVSNIGPGLLKSYDMDAVIYTLAECYFNQAEAAQRGYLGGDPQVFYENGIQASFDFLGATGAPSYYNQAINNVSWSASTNKIEAIITQKWLALNGVTTEQAWFDYNRTGYPSGLPISLLASTDDRPVRLFYPSSEITANGANVPTQPNAFTDKIFWGK